MSPKILVVAYGNPLRSDDGLAWRAADRLEGKFPARETEILRLHQLTPELAETISHSEVVIFLDAAPPGCGTPGEIRCAELHAAESKAPTLSHHLSAATLLAEARRLYAANPRAFSLTLTGENFDHGEELSPVVEAALPKLVDQAVKLVEQFAPPVPAAGSKP